MNFTASNFNNTGICWPLKLKFDHNSSNFEKEYFNFQKKAELNFKKNITLKPNLVSTFFDKIAFDENIIKEVKKLIGDDIYIWSSAIFAKPPGTGKMVSYHQDNPYWQLTTEKVVSAWVALTVSNKDSGALEVFPNSHNFGIINELDVTNPREAYLKGLKTTKSQDMLSYTQNLKKFLKENKSTIIELEPGEFSIHHVNAVHGSGVNNSSNHRVGFAIRYISSDTKHQKMKNDYALHVTGKKNDYFIDEKRPIKDFDKKDMFNYEKSMSSGGAFGNKKY